MKIKYIFMSLICLLGACSTPTESNYIRNVKAWLGRAPAELVSQWGEPTQVLNNGTEQFYVYTVDKDISLPGTNDRYAQGQLDYISPLEGTSAYQMNLYCQTTFVVKNDRIIDWLFEGNACKAR